MNADVLRRAAALMRERAEAATEGTWRVVPVNGERRADIRTEPELGYDYRGTAVATAADSEFGAVAVRDAAHIASWHPVVAVAVADWLDREAELSETLQKHGARGVTGIREHPALTVARAYLGDPEPPTVA